MDKGILLVSYVYECCVQTRHNLAYATQIDVAYGETRLTLLFVELHKHLVLAKCYGDLRWIYIDDKFSVHTLKYNVNQFFKIGEAKDVP